MRVTESDPSRGGSRGYDIYDREWMLAHAAQGHPVRASVRSLGRWGQRLERYRMTGNRDRTSLIGIDQLLLVLAISSLSILRLRQELLLSFLTQ